MLRAAVAAGTPVGLKAKDIMARGDLVPDDVVVGIVADRIEEPDAKKGFVLDGFPRTVPQAEALDGAGRARPRARRRDRAQGRRGHPGPAIENRVARDAGAGEALRADDNPEVLKQRLDAYRAQTAPLADYYRGKGTLKSVDGMAPIYEVTAAIDGRSRTRLGTASAEAAVGKPAGRQESRPARPAGKTGQNRRQGPGARKSAAKAQVPSAEQPRPPLRPPDSPPRPAKSRKAKRVPEVDEVAIESLNKPRIQSDFERCRPRSGGEGVALSLGAPAEQAGTAGAAEPAGTGVKIVARIAGVNIPTNKRVVIALQYIHGIGQKNAKDIMEKVSIPEERRVSQLTDQEVLQIREMIDRDYMVEGDLRRDVAMNIKRLMDLGCYRGLRHRRGLPVRGQRTHTNARTRKGPAKAIAGKKKVDGVDAQAELDSARFERGPRKDREWARKPPAGASAGANARTSRRASRT